MCPFASKRINYTNRLDNAQSVSFERVPKGLYLPGTYSQRKKTRKRGTRRINSVIQTAANKCLSPRRNTAAEFLRSSRSDPVPFSLHESHPPHKFQRARASTISAPFVTFFSTAQLRKIAQYFIPRVSSVRPSSSSPPPLSPGVFTGSPRPAIDHHVLHDTAGVRDDETARNKVVRA